MQIPPDNPTFTLLTEAFDKTYMELLETSQVSLDPAFREQLRMVFIEQMANTLGLHPMPLLSIVTEPE